MKAAARRPRPHRGKRGGRTDRFRLTLRLSPDERARLDAQANDAGLSLASYVRLATLGHVGPRARRKPPIERLALAELLVKTGRIGGNVYQLSRASNFGDPVLAADVADIVRDLRALTNEMRQALGRKVLA